MALAGEKHGAAVSRAAARLVWYALDRGLIEAGDERWAYNRLLECSGQTGPGPVDAATAQRQALAAGYDFEADLALLVRAGVEAGLAEDTPQGRDRLAMRCLGAVMPRPSQVARRFEALCRQQGPQAATSWFYRLSCDAGYVRRSAIAKNLKWTAATSWGDLEITINRSKPEKDPRAIAAAACLPRGDAYPACALCRENEGYGGRPAQDAGGHPARQNLRIVLIELAGEGYGLQYSPYAYFDEHCIVMSDAHRPMHVDRASLACLLDFVGRFPHYFIGSNADLPIVGGSILSHDHFQGGRHEFPMMRAEVYQRFAIAGYPQVDACVLRWPITALRLTAQDPACLLDAAMRVLCTWRSWDDPAVGVVSHSPDGIRHNTVTPICRLHGGSYELYLALRCNVTDADHPLGVFHPHQDKWHIKKENIGLIEVMGLAVLPPRLERELKAVRELLAAADLDGLESDPAGQQHAVWARKVYQAHPQLAGMGEDEARGILRQEVGEVFSRVLEDAGVFKWDGRGRQALSRFLEALGA